MARTIPKPVPRLGTFSPAAKAAHADRQDEAEARAFARWQVAKFAAVAYARCQSERETHRRVRDAMDSGVLPPRAPSSRNAVRTLLKAWESGHRDIADYRDAPRHGRPKAIPAPVVESVRLAVRLANYGSLRQLADRVAREAMRDGLYVPSYESVRRLVATEGRCVRAASAYGSRVAQQEALPLGTVPARAIHDTWVLDEATLPFWVRVFDADTATWCSTRPTLISVVDHKSGACVGYWVADPTAHRDTETGAIARSGYDANDVMAALLSAALLECATPATAAFSGHLPMALRWDNHATHQLLRKALEGWDQLPIPEIRSFFPAAQDEAGLVDELLDEATVSTGAVPPPGGEQLTLSSRDSVTIPKLPVQRPINRGKVERKLGTIKARFGDVPTAITQVIPLDRLTTAPVEMRRLAAGAGDRTPRLDPIAVERLPTMEEARQWVEARIHTYNHEERSRAIGHVTRRVAYERARPTQLRKGTDLLLALPTHSVPVTREGLTITRAQQVFAFSPFVDNHFVLPIDQLVALKMHPLGLMAWARIGDRHYRLRPRIEVASAQDAAERVARMQYAAAGFASDEAKAARALVFETRFGPGAAEADSTAAKALLALQAEQTQKAQAAPIGDPGRAPAAPWDDLGTAPWDPAGEVPLDLPEDLPWMTSLEIPAERPADANVREMPPGSDPVTGDAEAPLDVPGEYALPPDATTSRSWRPARTGASRLRHVPVDLPSAHPSAQQRRGRRVVLPPSSGPNDASPA